MKKRFIAAAILSALFIGAGFASDTSSEWKNSSGEVVAIGTLDVERTLDETPGDSAPSKVYFRTEGGKTLAYRYRWLGDDERKRVDEALSAPGAAEVVEEEEAAAPEAVAPPANDEIEFEEDVETSQKEKPNVDVAEPAAGTRKTITVKGAEYAFRYCPAGMFEMGSPIYEENRASDETRHRVVLSGFWMLETEVTVGMWRTFAEATNYKTGPGFEGKGGYGFNASTGKFESGYQYTWENPGFEQTDDCPVTQIDWAGAVAFGEWLADESGLPIRLPTEAEWEYACRAKTTTPYYFGKDGKELHRYGNVADASAKEYFSDWSNTIAGTDGYVFTAPVKSFEPNAWGLYDMCGNVWERCLDWYDEDYGANLNVVLRDPYGAAEGSWRVLRGGSWRDSAKYCRSAYRNGSDPTNRYNNHGFRLVLGR